MSDFYNKYPYTDFHELNLDWVIERVKKLTEDWLATQEAWNNTQEQWQQLHDYVMDYFVNLDVQDEINNKINAMIADGTFLSIVTPTINQTVVNATNDWLAANISQPTTPAIDKTLLISGAGADSEITGIRINETVQLADTAFTICNDTTPALSFKQGYYTNDGTYDASATNQITTDLLKIPDECDISITTNDTSFQTVIREYIRTGNTFIRSQNLVNNGNLTLTGTKGEYYYAIGLYKADGVIPSDASILTIEYRSDINDLYDLVSMIENDYMHLRTPNTTDVNDFTDNGVYQVNTSYSNVPADMSNNGYMITFGSAASRIGQILSQNSGGSDDMRLWFRTINGVTWGPWRSLLTGSDRFNVFYYHTSASTDVNDYTSNGVYSVNTGYSNTPSDMNDNGCVLTVKSSPTRMMQLLSQYVTNIPKYWIRTMGTGGFSSWYRIETEKSNNISYVNADSYSIKFGKYKVELYHTVNAGNDQDNWNVGNIMIGTDTVVTKGTDILGPIKLDGDDDFLSGVHGSSTTTVLKVFADGAELTLDSSLSADFDTLTIQMIDECRRTTDQSHCFNRYVTVEITRNKMHVMNTFKNVSGGSLTVSRATNGGLMAVQNPNLLSTSMNNYIATSAPTAAISNGNIENIHVVFNTIYGSISVTNILGHQKATYIGFYQVFTNETPIRTKSYFDVIGSNTSIADGAIIPGEFIYEFA